MCDVFGPNFSPALGLFLIVSFDQRIRKTRSFALSVLLIIDTIYYIVCKPPPHNANLYMLRGQWVNSVLKKLITRWSCLKLVRHLCSCQQFWLPPYHHVCIFQDRQWAENQVCCYMNFNQHRHFTYYYLLLF